MNDIAKMLTPPNDDKAPFPPNSRYYGLGTRRTALPDGREIAYVARRFLPARDAYVPIAIHMVQSGDRLDLLGAQHFGDPEQGWRIVEANGVRDPRVVLKEAGSRIVIAKASALASGTGG